MTRITDPRTAAKVLIMQRLHLEDATNWALTNWPKDTVHLMFPARYDPHRACDCDERTYEGELLWGSVWTDEELSKIEQGLAALDGEILSNYAVSGQLQQYPIPRGGGIINQDDWKVWPEETPRHGDLRFTRDGNTFVPLPEVGHVIVTLDTAISEKDSADWNACVIWGIWHRPKLTSVVRRNDPFDDGEQPRVIMMGGWRRRCRLNDESLDHDGMPKGLVQRLIATARRFDADRIIIENKNRGTDVRNEIERQLFNQSRIELFEPRRHGDKAARLHAVQPLFSQGLVYAPAYCRLVHDDRGNEQVEVGEFNWVRDIIAEVEAVPRGAHDDYADCVSMGLLTLRDGGYLELTHEFTYSQLRARQPRIRPNRVLERYGLA